MDLKKHLFNVNKPSHLWEVQPYLVEVSKELYCHFEQYLILMDSGCEALADLDQLVNDLVLLSLGVAFQGQ